MSRRWLQAAMVGLVIVAIGVSLRASIILRVCLLSNAARESQVGRYLELSRVGLGGDARCPADFEIVRSSVAHHFAERDIDPGRLWRTLPEFGSPDAVAAWEANREIRFARFEGWSVPEDPTWGEDPFANRSWLTYYQSLSWLQAPAAAYRQSGDPALPRVILSYVLDWIADNPRGDAQSVRSWYDHAVAYRTDALVGLFPLLADEATPAEMEILLKSLHEHGARLERLLADDRFVGHNHNLFHALSLFNLATALPELKGADRWRAAARARVGSLLREMVDPVEGVSTEQALGYHFLALRLFVDGDRFLRQHGAPLSDADRALLAKMAEFGVVMAGPDGVLPAIGDTEYGALLPRSDLLAYAAEGIETDLSRFVLTRRAEGTRPPDALFWPSTGYALFRPSRGDEGTLRDDLQVIVDMGEVRRPHGHRDAMNVLMNAGGGPLLVDSGGPYLFDDPRRLPFVATRAHNTVVIDDADQANGTVRILRTADVAAYSLIDGVSDLSAARHRRLVLMLKPGTVLILDRLTATDGGTHEYDLLYHFPPGAQVQAVDGGAQVATAAGAALTIAVATSAEAAVRVVEGQDAPSLGWVTPALSQRVPAPVLEYSLTARDAWLATLLIPGQALADRPAAVTAQEAEGVLRVAVDTGAELWCVEVPDDPEADVRVIPGCGG